MRVNGIRIVRIEYGKLWNSMYYNTYIDIIIIIN